MAELKTAFPRQAVEAATLATYAKHLLDLPVQAGRAAVNRLVCTATFFPAIAELRRAVVDEMVDLPTSEAAWEQVCVLLKHFPSAPDSTWEPPIAPHPLVMRVVREVGGLWALTHSENPIADRAHSLKLYAELRDGELTKAVVNPTGYVAQTGLATQQMQAWQQRTIAEAKQKAILALPPAKRSPMPADFRAALKRFTAKVVR